MILPNKPKTKRLRKSEYPEFYLLMGILEQAFTDIECYYLDKGTSQQRMQGRKAIRWIMNKEETFTIITTYIELSRFSIPSDNIYLWCKQKIERLRGDIIS